MPTRSSKKRPRDPNQLAAAIVAESTGDAPTELESAQPKKNPAAVALGRFLVSFLARANRPQGRKVPMVQAKVLESGSVLI